MATKSEWNGVQRLRRLCQTILVLQFWWLAACDSDPQTLEIPDEPGAFSSDISYEYDALDRLSIVRYANGDVIRYSYDETGNILSVEMDKAN